MCAAAEQILYYNMTLLLVHELASNEINHRRNLGHLQIGCKWVPFVRNIHPGRLKGAGNPGGMTGAKT